MHRNSHTAIVVRGMAHDDVAPGRVVFNKPRREERFQYLPAGRDRKAGVMPG